MLDLQIQTWSEDTKTGSEAIPIYEREQKLLTLQEKIATSELTEQYDYLPRK